MSDRKNLEEWFKEDLTQTPQKLVDEERERIEQVVVNQGGNMLPVDSSLSRPKKIMSIFVGEFVASVVQGEEVPTITIEDITDEIAGKRKNIRTNLNDLKNKYGFIESVEKGKFQIVPGKLSKILDYILGES